MRSTNGSKLVNEANMENNKTNTVPSHPFSHKRDKYVDPKGQPTTMRYNNYINFIHGE